MNNEAPEPDSNQSAGNARDFDWALRELADGWINVFEREGPHGFNQNALRVLNSISDDAATSMRSACIEKVKEFRDASYWSDVNYAALTKLMSDVESISIQEQEKQL